jgi:uncharacterized protein
MNTIPEHEAVVRWLARPETYAHRPDRVEQIETHISHLFLVGSYVYKLKKPVRYDFLDFSTIKNREEVRLNRRLATDVYLGVAPIWQGPGGEFRWDGVGEIVLTRSTAGESCVQSTSSVWRTY